MNKSNYAEMLQGLGDQFVCPSCEFEYIHFETPTYIDGNDDGQAWGGRGDAIKIPMWCENSHGWTLIVGFHKGGTFLKIEGIRNLTPVEVKHYRLDDGTNK